MSERQALLVDFGTTSIKSAVLHLDDGSFSRVHSHASLPNRSPVPGHYELDPAALRDRFLAICGTYMEGCGAVFDGVFICSEQNGFVALDGHDRPLTNYISWKDERSREPLDGVDTFSLVMERLGDRFKAITGWRPGPNLPLTNVTHLGRQGLLTKTCRIATLPEWLALCSGDSLHVVHDTMLHGLGFYDVHSRSTSNELVGLVEELTGVRCTFGALGRTGSVAGYWHHAAERIPIHVGIGDHQCSVLGANNLPRETLSVNIGTGSQVGVVGADAPPEQAELRPYFGDDRLATITRIPGGRALAGFIGFLEDVCRAQGVERPDFWRMLGELTEAEVQSSTLRFDLAIFASAWGYRGGGQIAGIAEGAFTLRNYLGSLLKSLAQQYVQVMALFDPQHTLQRCILSGGVARRLPALCEVLTSLSGYETVPTCALDETLLGLRTVACMAFDASLDYVRAGAVFGRECRLRDNW